MTYRIVSGLIAISACSLVCVGGVNAQISPNPNTFSMGGPVVFSQVGGGTINCNMNMNVSVHAGGMTGQVTSASFSGAPLYSAVHGVSLSWNVERISPTTFPRFKVSGIAIKTLDGTCDNGTMIFTWGGSSVSAHTDGVMPGRLTILPYPAASCTVSGTFNVTSGGPVSVN